MVGAILEVKKGDVRIGLSTIDGPSDGHLGTIDAVAGAEMHDDIAIEEIVTRVECERWIRAEVKTTFRFWWGQRQVDATPTCAAICRKVSAHWQPEDLIRAGC